ncbi:MAG: 23S rRNA (uracil(1939)-C(5))-methyltransferase RlmD [Lachnospiraceae bacterium]|nr:23S rRNA (uracil(1939)-C(5))-methyltransferase RlmD [Candidatus Colinaster scatohippi]
MTYKKDDRLTIEITDTGVDGEGIGKIDGYTLFVKDAVIGDVVEAKIMKAKKNYAYARLEKVITPSPFRVNPRCQYARSCGGCQIQALDYSAQLKFKQNKVRNNIVRLGGFAENEIDSVMESIIGMEESYRYRGKAQFPFGTNKDGEVITGFYAGRTHSIIANTDCIIGVEENKEILELILAHMRKYNIPAYNEVTGKGLIRHALIRKGFATGEIMVCLVINLTNASESKEYIPSQDKLINELKSVHGMTSVSVSINTQNTNVIMGNQIITLWGQDVIHDTINGISFSISPLSFYQVNPIQTEKLYGKAIEYAALTGDESVWDLYCGIGTISLCMAKKAGRVYGVEIIPQAIEDANRNAKANDIENVKFFVGKAEEVLPEFYERKSVSGKNSNGSGEEGTNADGEMLNPDVIVVDPPRKGCDDKCLDTMLRMSPERIVYVSCDSATLARDLRILVDGGYKLKKVCPVDMFPHSVHVETVCLLSRKAPV